MYFCPVGDAVCSSYLPVFSVCGIVLSVLEVQYTLSLYNKLPDLVSSIEYNLPSDNLLNVQG